MTVALLSPPQKVHISQARIWHTYAVSALNNKYLHQNNRPGNQANNTFIIRYTASEVGTIIKNNEIAIATAGDDLIAYYLTGNNCQHAALAHEQGVAARFVKNKFTPISKIAIGVQVCIDETYRDIGLFKTLLQCLVTNIAHKYDYLLCSVAVGDSLTLKIHLQHGWELFEKSAGNNYLVYRTHK